VFTVGILTTSDMGAKGEREDVSGQAIVELVTAAGFRVEIRGIIPDDRATIADRLQLWSQKVDLILTTGGTGFGPRDVTPEATLEVLERQAPGLSEYMRAGTAEKTTLSYLSRGVAGTLGDCLIVNLPGRPAGVRECLELLLPLLPHVMDTMQGPTQQHPQDQAKS
jgi:molybdopterin adenylyltransferase